MFKFEIGSTVYPKTMYGEASIDHGFVVNTREQMTIGEVYYNSSEMPVNMYYVDGKGGWYDEARLTQGA
jgi:hypothetical protein